MQEFLIHHPKHWRGKDIAEPFITSRQQFCCTCAHANMYSKAAIPMTFTTDWGLINS